ncbi:MAG: TIGR03118 family protein [Isosphaeraceae bacterium]
MIRLDTISRATAWSRALRFIAGIALLGMAAGQSRAGGFYKQTNLVSDVPGLAKFTDPNLKNPWGISFGPTTFFWVSNQGSDTSTLYNTAGQPQALVVSIPTTGSGPQGPTGQVFNGTGSATDFLLSNGNAARFLFANLNGTISGWNGGAAAQIVASATSAIYTGLAIGSNGSGNFLYAANSAANTIDVFNGTFAQTSLSGSFVDPNLPAGFTVYNIQRFGSSLYVTYENEATGGGVINEFDLNGNFIRRISSNGDGGPLDSPWGMAIAPSGFGTFAGKLLVGNEDDGRISAFDLTTGDFVGQLLDESGNPISNTGLWGLAFGNGGNGGDPNTLYFAAGINGERNGLFGAITFVPEPSSMALAFMAGGVLALRCGVKRVRRTAP